MNGIIAEVRGNKAVLVSENGSFKVIPNRNYEKGEKVFYKNTYYKQALSIAACFLFIFIAGNIGYSLYFTPVSHVSIDINPSIQLEVNRFHIVCNEIAWNDDALAVLEKAKVRHKNIGESVIKILEVSKSMGYRVDHGAVIDIIEKDDAILEQLKHNTAAESSVIVEKVSDEKINKSKELSVSIGRVNAVDEYTEAFGGDFNAHMKELSDVSVANVKKMAKEQNKDNSLEGSIEKEKQDNKENKQKNNKEKDPANKIEKNSKDLTPAPKPSTQDNSNSTETTVTPNPEESAPPPGIDDKNPSDKDKDNNKKDKEKNNKVKNQKNKKE